MDWAVFGWSIGAAVGFAVAAAFKHASAERLQHLDRLSLGAVRHFVSAIVSQRLWWMGTAADAVAVCLHALALRRGALSVVQPLLVTVLVFGLVARGFSQARADRPRCGGRSCSAVHWQGSLPSPARQPPLREPTWIADRPSPPGSSQWL